LNGKVIVNAISVSNDSQIICSESQVLNLLPRLPDRTNAIPTATTCKASCSTINMKSANTGTSIYGLTHRILHRKMLRSHDLKHRLRLPIAQPIPTSLKSRPRPSSSWVQGYSIITFFSPRIPYLFRSVKPLELFKL
jgi:hypothetical protein